MIVSCQTQLIKSALTLCTVGSQPHSSLLNFSISWSCCLYSLLYSLPSLWRHLLFILCSFWEFISSLSCNQTQTGLVRSHPNLDESLDHPVNSVGFLHECVLPYAFASLLVKMDLSIKVWLCPWEEMLRSRDIFLEIQTIATSAWIKWTLILLSGKHLRNFCQVTWTDYELLLPDTCSMCWSHLLIQSMSALHISRHGKSESMFSCH